MNLKGYILGEILTVTVSLTAFSQSDTICLKTAKFDWLITEHLRAKALRNDTAILRGIISDRDIKIGILNRIIAGKDEQLNICETQKNIMLGQLSNANRAIETQTRKKRIWRGFAIGAGCLVVFQGFLLYMVVK